MRKVCYLIVMLAMMSMVQAQAEGYAIKIEFGGTSMTFLLKENPKIVTENGNLVLKTNSTSVILSLPCKATFVGSADDETNGIVNIRNYSEKQTIDVRTLDGKKVAIMNKDDMINLERGIYIINGKKILIR